MAESKTPNTMKEYLQSLSEVQKVNQFFFREIETPQSRAYIRRMIIFNIYYILLENAVAVSTGYIFSGYAAHSSLMMNSAIILTVVGMLVQKMFDRQVSRAREWILSIHWRNQYRRIVELFLEKSPGQHIQETALTTSSIEKGSQNLFALQGLVFFEAIPVVVKIALSWFLLITIGFVSMVKTLFTLVDYRYAATAFVYPFLISVAMTLTIIAYLVYSVYLNFQVMKVCKPIDKSFRILHRRRAERMDKAIRVKICNQTEREVDEMDRWFEKDIAADRNFWLWFIDKSTWRNVMNIVLFGVVMGVGARLAWIGVWEIGFLFPIFSWSRAIIDNIWQLGSVEQKINWNLPSVKSMITALSIPADIVDPPNAITLCHLTPQPIVLSDISHAYPRSVYREHDEADGDESEDIQTEEIPPTLTNIGFSIEVGQKVALLGASGSGKTTVMRLLLRFMDPLTGSITVGGNDLRAINRNSWTKCIGYIAQQPDVLDGTIRENLTYRLSPAEREKITDDEIWALMRRLKIDFGARLEKGLDTKVGKHGLKLSGGQAQRLMIGSAVIGKPWFMIIDEATSSLDSTTERQVQEGLTESISGNTSALIVAHRLSTVRHLCTKFVVLKPANQVIEGESQVEAVATSFEELYTLSPTFRSLADDQGLVLSPTHLEVRGG